jgi:energy-coupling factor transporter transmembrane protein EcfT
MNLNAPHFHIAVNHLPVVGSMGIALLLIFALFPAGRPYRRFALVALVVVALAGLPAFFSGEPAEDGIENIVGVEETRIEQHEDVARTAVIVLELAGAIGLFGLMLFRRKAVPGSLLALALAVDLGAAALMTRTASLGGEIRHPEIRSGAAALPASEADDKD